MKKFILILFLLVMCLLIKNNGICMSYNDALKSSKPMVVAVYADWADDIDNVKNIFENMEQKYSNKYNFVMLNIASEDTKEFNKKFYIYPNLPYVLLIRDNGKVTRYLKKDCAMSSSCLEEKIRFFIN